MPNIKPEALGDAIAEALTLYSADVTERLNTLSEDAARALVEKTKATAPKSKQGGSYRKHIAFKLLEQNRLGNKVFVWYVKPPDHRLTHLLVHGHVTRDGGRTRKFRFLHDACDEVLGDYEQKVQEELREK